MAFVFVPPASAATASPPPVATQTSTSSPEEASATVVFVFIVFVLEPSVMALALLFGSLARRKRFVWLVFLIVTLSFKDCPDSLLDAGTETSTASARVVFVGQRRPPHLDGTFLLGVGCSLQFFGGKGRVVLLVVTASGGRIHTSASLALVALRSLAPIIDAGSLSESPPQAAMVAHALIVVVVVTTKKASAPVAGAPVVGASLVSPVHSGDFAAAAAAGSRLRQLFSIQVFFQNKNGGKTSLPEAGPQHQI